MNERQAQDGMTLIEVLVALLILTLGLLGAAVVQIKALQYSDSSRMSTQASFIAYDMLDRIRANVAADYTLATSASGGASDVRHQDLHEFASNVESFAGPSAKGSISVNRQVYTIRITWDDARAEGQAVSLRSLELSSRVAPALGDGA
ncbi:type IV pilus modification protein PilV [Pseudomonas sp. LD120]|uniref:type IV pilus modification protein PilV n=1 Tax=Pseudomonas sp. LD120 TaxID=485751 RepID=UPI00135BA338|nr:type IV pilus modification protein PilV [Pseudomonas sp. LD120]KAF0866921.1 type IV pilus modification protein PilV [Pseudomonas sp. LD120]